jgi:anti-anti-sigma factor
MNFIITEHEDIVTVTPHRTVTHEDLALLRNRLWDLIEGRSLIVVLDLRELPCIDTRFLSFFIELKNKLNGNLALAHANDLIKNLFAMTRLTDTTILCDTMEAV